jgi:hypothetical protein
MKGVELYAKVRGYLRAKLPVRPKLDGFIAIIERILAEDRDSDVVNTRFVSNAGKTLDGSWVVNAYRIGLIVTPSIAMSLCALLPDSADARDCQWQARGGSIAILAQRDMDSATIFSFEIQPIISRNVTLAYRFPVPIGENDFRFFLQTSSPQVRYSVALLNGAGKAIGREIGVADYSYKAVKPEKLTLTVKALLPFREWIALGSLSACTV